MILELPVTANTQEQAHRSMPKSHGKKRAEDRGSPDQNLTLVLDEIINKTTGKNILDHSSVP